MSLFGEEKRFFGDSAGPIAQGVSRRNPMAIGMYAVVMSLGAIFVFHLYAANRSEADLFPGVAPWITMVWKWSMMLGGAGAVTAIFLNPRAHPHWPDLVDLLHLEAVFAIVSVAGLCVYVYVVVRLQGFGQSYQVAAIYLVMVLAHFARSLQCAVYARRLEALYTAVLLSEAARDGD